MDDISLLEPNEAYAAKAMIVTHDLDLPQAKMNQNSGGYAPDYAIGASGARISRH